MDVRKRQALSFGPAAATYDRFRPRYPAEAVEWAVGSPPPARVVDLGAGTGILTRGLIALGFTPVPVEPDEGMRAQLADATPDTTSLAGSAERIPLPDGSVDAVVAGQAYHWFDHDLAHAEAARVLRPGGTLAAIWNLRDSREPWVAGLDRIARALGDDDHPGPESFGGEFGPIDRREFDHVTVLTPDELVAMMTTRSYYLTASAGDRARFEDEIRTLAATHPDLAGRESFGLPYRTMVYRASTLRS